MVLEVTRGDSAPTWQRAVVTLSCAVVGLVVMLGLQWGRPILIPISLAILLTFLLNPIVRTLELRGLGRVFSVMVAVTLAGVMLTCLGWMVTREVAELISKLPQNTANIKAKVKTIRALGSGEFADQFARMVEDVSNEFQRPAPEKTLVIDESQGHTDIPAAATTGNVHFKTESTFWLRLTGYLGSAMEVLATLAFAQILLVFFLIGREDLRDRLVLLAGTAHLALTSKALEDITERISRYILVVAIINGGFGILLTIGLLVLGVPYALLWGFLAAVLRFLPYIGPWVGAAFPIVMSLATFEGWWQPIAVLGYFMILELTIGNIVEPYVFGHSTGVSPTALIISAAFWLYLWGPVGLVFSAPFAVCLVVLGKNIEQLGFLNLLLGDLPALRANVGIYQRLMLGDEHETVRLVLQHIKELPADQVYDNMLVPVLNYTRRDIHRNYLNEEDRETILRCLRDSLNQIDSFRSSMIVGNLNRDDSQPEAADLAICDKTNPHVILGYPASDDIDSVGLEMLGKLFDPSHWKLEVTTETTSTPELLTQMAECQSEVVCVSSFPPGGLTHAVAICKRLRTASPKILIIVGRWGQKSKSKTDREQLELAGANFVAVTLSETLAWLDARYPLTQVTPMKASPSVIPDRVAMSGITNKSPGA